jgi:hypothetical protein
VAKILFPESVLCVQLNEREIAQAVQVPDSFRDYLHTKKYEIFCEMKGIDTTDAQSSPLRLAATLAKLAVYDELLLFIAARPIQDFDPE